MTEELIQGTDEWHQARLGKVTASRISDMLARTKSGWGAGRKNYMAELIAERLTGQKAEGFQNAAMDRGNEVEPQARAAYTFFTDNKVTEVGLALHPTIEMAAASPDGLVGDDGGVEIKCPNTATHIDTMLGGSIKKIYRDQMMFQMACTGRQWVDFVSFDPRLPGDQSLFITRIERDDEQIAEVNEQVVAFLAELDEKLARLGQIKQTDAVVRQP